MPGVCHQDIDMHQLETQIEIAASVERVWSLLTDFASYPQWNPFIRSIEGHLEVGRRLNVFIQPPDSRGMHFKPTLLAVERNRELRWKGKLLMAGLFDGEHYFRIESAPGGATFHQGEIFSGVLVPFFRSSLEGATKQGFISMNEALKRKAENYKG
jgi:hypothetical protein